MLVRLMNSKNKIDNHGSQQSNRQQRRTETVVKPALTAFAYTLRSPVEGEKRIDHGCHGNDSEQTGGDAADAITEIQKTDGKTAEDHREVQP